MCITRKSKVLSVSGNRAIVDGKHGPLEVRIDLIPGVRVGDYLFCASGMAVEKAEGDD